MILMVCFMQSCKEGCKDKKALNYDSKATVENGTCMYCSSANASDTATYFFTSSNAPNPNVFSIEFIVVGGDASIAGNGCQTVGKQVSNNCHSYLSVVNLTNEHIDGSFDAQFIQNATTAWFFQTNFLEMGPPGSGLDTINFGAIDSVACINIATGTLQPNLSGLQFF